MNSYRKEEAVEKLINPIEVRKERTSACSQKRSGPAEAKQKSQGDAQKVLEEKNQRYQKDKLKER